MGVEGLNEYFVFGVEELDRRFTSAIKLGGIVAIVGGPGTGKTTLASRICFINASRGYPCVYISTQEFKEKHYTNMLGLGMNFQELEDRGLMKFINVPIPGTLEHVEDLFNLITNVVNEMKARILIIDSITPVLRVLASDISRRAWLQNFIYTLSKALRGVLVLTVEILDGDASVSDVEYVADALITLRQEQTHGLLVRKAHLVKMRGAQIEVSEVPYTIREGFGVEFWFPPVLAEVPPPSSETLRMPCKALSESLGNLPKGSYVYVAHEVRPTYQLWVPLLASLAKLNRLGKLLIVSYSSSPSEWFGNALNALISSGVPKDLAEEIIKTYFEVKSLNPASYSVDELYALELSLAKALKPSVIIFWEANVPEFIHMSHDISKYSFYLTNQLFLLKSLGITTFRFATALNEEIYKVTSFLATASLKYLIDPDKGSHLLIWSNERIKKLHEKDLISCVEECASILKKG
ncbi:MAG: hypothetical protein B7O98_02125 [Zestosphaera tikiterensis]|uniref:KaiC domain-containing protein n=1 Tax=Zestosphaera tikiterensis TaxID=1973259 RepID=A0A2R7Y6U6_9CREN|nr:MAG: hypothetical protein B7O98_02125 [Zestosphaera tikiterensis]